MGRFFALEGREGLWEMGALLFWVFADFAGAVYFLMGEKGKENAG
jgi:hypothetical protein